MTYIRAQADLPVIVLATRLVQALMCERGRRHGAANRQWRPGRDHWRVPVPNLRLKIGRSAVRPRPWPPLELQVIGLW